MRSKIIGTILLLLLVAAVAAHAQNATGVLEANSLEIHATGTLNSTVAVALGEWSTLDPILPDSSVQLAGSHARVKTFYADPKASADAVGIALEGNIREESYDEFSLVGQAVRSNYKLAVFPGDAVASIATDCMQLAPAVEQVITRKSNVRKADEPDNEVTADVTGAVRVRLCEDATVQVKGDFLLTFWEWDATLESNGETVDLLSGRQRSQYDPVGSSAMRDSVSDSRHLYLYVTGGTLQLPARSLNEIYVRQADVGARGSFEFRGVTGQMDVDTAEHAVNAQSLRLLGNLQVALLASNGTLSGNVDGSLDSADADGQLLALTATSNVVSVDATWVWGLLASLALAAAMAWRLSRPTRLEWHTRRAMVAMDEQRFRAALWHCTAALHIRRVHAEARIMRALALTRLDRIEAALKDHEAAHGILAREGGGELGAQNAVEAALTTLERGDKTQARRWLEAASRCDAGAVYALLTADHREALRPLMVNVRAAGDAYA